LTVSILIPNRNYAQFLPIALDSAIRQTYPNKEIFICDDNSTDNSIEIIKDYVERYPGLVNYVALQDGRPSIPKARNKLLELARGELIAFQSSDDYWHEEFLQETVSFLERTGEQSVYTDYYIFADGIVLPPIPFPSIPINESMAIVKLPSFTDREEMWKESLRNSIIYLNAFLCRRSFYERFGPFDESILHGEEYFLLMNAVRRALIPHLAKPLGYRRMHSHQMTWRPDRIRYARMLRKKAISERGLMWRLRNYDGHLTFHEFWKYYYSEGAKIKQAIERFLIRFRNC
jgi:glycosyltransferase involved in cell wall biosynthesis